MAIRTLNYENELHYPLGSASYIFEKDILKYINSTINKDTVYIAMGAQPNSTPHFGTMIVFSLGFSLAKELSALNPDKNIKVVFEAVDTAVSKSEIINNIKYQISLREDIESTKYFKQFESMIKKFSKLTGVDYIIRRQKEFNSSKDIGNIVENIITNREMISKIIEPKNETLRVRIACPKCGRADKNGINNEYIGSKIISECPYHGKFEADIYDESYRLEYSTPLRAIIKNALYQAENNDLDIEHQWIRIIGSDYAGVYQEQLIHKSLSKLGFDISSLPFLLYAPLILDWSGAKISKSLYLKKGAYKYLPEYLLDYQRFDKETKGEGLSMLIELTDEWIRDPKKLFRHYTVYYFMEAFKLG
ncbi:hypothetical protein QA538_11295 (plasmid) [Macrococcus sp. CCM 2573]